MPRSTQKTSPEKSLTSPATGTGWNVGAGGAGGDWNRDEGPLSSIVISKSSPKREVAADLSLPLSTEVAFAVSLPTCEALLVGTLDASGGSSLETAWYLALLDLGLIFQKSSSSDDRNSYDVLAALRDGLFDADAAFLFGTEKPSDTSRSSDSVLVVWRNGLFDPDATL